MARTRAFAHALLLIVPVLAAVAVAPSASADFPNWHDYECHVPSGIGCPGGTLAVVQAGDSLAIHNHDPMSRDVFVRLTEELSGNVVMIGCAPSTPSGPSPGFTYTFRPLTLYRLEWSNPSAGCPTAIVDERLIISGPGVVTLEPPCTRSLNGVAITHATATRPALGDRECVGGDPWDEDCNGHSSEWGDPEHGSGTRRYTNACTTGDPHVCHGEGTTHKEYQQDSETGAYSSRTTGSYGETCGGDGGDCYGVWREQGTLEEGEDGRMHKVPTSREWVTKVCPAIESG